MIGNSYYFLYFCIVLVKEYVFKIIDFNVSYLKNENLLEEIIVCVLIVNIIGVVILVMFINVGIFFWFVKNFRVKESIFKNYI